MNIIRGIRRICVSPLPVPASWYAVPLRLMVGLGFIEHGYAKLARGPEDFIAILHAIGMPFAQLFGWATIAVEIVGGGLILLGAFIPVATLPMIIYLRCLALAISSAAFCCCARKSAALGPAGRNDVRTITLSPRAPVEGTPAAPFSPAGVIANAGAACRSATASCSGVTTLPVASMGAYGCIAIGAEALTLGADGTPTA